MHALFLNYSTAKLLQLLSRIEVCLGRLTPEQVWHRSGEPQNAIGNLLLHLAGNVRQWIGHGVAGWPNVRTRDAEFAACSGAAPSELLEALRVAVNDAVGVISSLTPDQLAAPTQLQGYELSKLEAVYHVVEHFSMHTGQILLLTKQHLNQDLGFYRHLSASTHTEPTP